MLLNTVLFAFLATAVYADPPDSIKNSVLQVCEEYNVTSATLQQAQVYLDKLVECPPIMSNIAQLPVELESAIPNGTVDGVARRFCAKAEEIKSCRTNVLYGMGLCMKLDTELYLPYLSKIMNSTIDYICSEEHQQTILANMVDEGVIQCAYNRSRGLSQCLNFPPGSAAYLRAGFKTTARCAADKFKACSLVAGARAQDMFNYIYDKLLPLMRTVSTSNAGLNKLFAF